MTLLYHRYAPAPQYGAPRRRPRVALQGRDEIREIYRVRAAMLGLCVSEACEHASAEEITELRETVTQMQRAAQTGDREGYY